MTWLDVGNLAALAFVGLGVAAVMREQAVLAVPAYAVPAAIVTALVRARELGPGG